MQAAITLALLRDYSAVKRDRMAELFGVVIFWQLIKWYN